LASHVCGPAHESGSSAFVTVTHAPVPIAHVTHTPMHGPEQQTLSRQIPDSQSRASVQVPAPVAMSAKSSAVDVGALAESPPAISTFPDWSAVAVWRARAVLIDVAPEKLGLASKISDVDTAGPSKPPTTTTFPEARRVAVC
jgi:hypothetical protein